MNLRQIEVFRAVMQTGSTSQAARLLVISQPTVSNIIRQLESQIRVKLFERIKGRLYPTPEADVLFAESDRLFNCFEALEHLAEDLAGNQVGTLRLAATPGIGYTIMPQAIANFRRDRPKIKASLHVSHYENIVRMVTENQFDLGLTITPTNHPNLRTSVIREGVLVCVVPANHPLVSRDTIRPADLRGFELISFASSTPMGIVVDRIFRQAGELRTIDVEVRFCYTACKLVQQNAGVAIVDEFTVMGGDFQDLVVKPLETTERLPICVSYSTERPLSSIARTFFADYFAGLIAVPAGYVLP